MSFLIVVGAIVWIYNTGARLGPAQIVDRLFHVCINFGQIPDICYHEANTANTDRRLEVQLRSDVAEVWHSTMSFHTSF